MLLSQAVAGFLIDRDGESEADLSPQTLALYRKCLGALIKHLNDPEVTSIRKSDLIGFMTYLEREHQPRRPGAERLSGYALDNHWKAIRSFFGWAKRELKVKRPDLDLPRPSFAAEEIIPFAEDEIRKVLDACEYTREAKSERRRGFKMRRPTAIRDRAIVLLLLETGIRIGELCRLKIEDVNLEAGEVHIRPYRNGVKSRARTIPIEKGCKRALWHYTSRERVDALPDEPLFPLALSSVQTLMQRLEERTGLSQVNAHKFRHTFAIQYLRNGGDVFTLQRILGHRDMTMVRRYLAIAQSDVKDAHRRASPVDRWRL